MYGCFYLFMILSRILGSQHLGLMVVVQIMVLYLIAIVSVSFQLTDWILWCLIYLFLLTIIVFLLTSNNPYFSLNFAALLCVCDQSTQLQGREAS